MTLYRLIYHSECAIPGEEAQAWAELREIAEGCHATNAATGVSGAMMLNDRSILQAIEGPLDAVEATFERICGDVRHRRIQLVEFGAVPERCFGEWPMAAIAPSQGLSSLCGQSEFRAGGRLDPATVEAMLQLMRSIILTERDAAVSHPASAEGNSRFC